MLIVYRTSWGLAVGKLARWLNHPATSAQYFSLDLTVRLASCVVSLSGLSLCYFYQLHCWCLFVTVATCSPTSLKPCFALCLAMPARRGASGTSQSEVDRVMRSLSLKKCIECRSSGETRSLNNEECRQLVAREMRSMQARDAQRTAKVYMRPSRPQDIKLLTMRFQGTMR